MKTKRIFIIGALLVWLFGCSDSLLGPADDTGLETSTEQSSAESGGNRND